MNGTITKAMREWCRRLRDPKVCTLKRSPRSWSISTSGIAGYGNPTWVMVDKLEDAGLIRFRVDAEGFDVAHLTDAGSAAGIDRAHTKVQRTVGEHAKGACNG